MGAFAIACILVASDAHASELMATANAAESGSISLSVYGQHVEHKPVADVGSGGAIQVPGVSGSLNLFTETNAEVEMDSSYDASVLAFSFRPRDGLHYRAKAGQIRDYELVFASGAATNVLSDLDHGFLWGAGLTWNVAPGSIVSTAFSLALDYTETHIGFDRFESGFLTAGSAIDLERREFQGAMSASRRFGRIEPYGGLKYLRAETQLVDGATRERIRGTDDGLSPFIGVAIRLFAGEWLMIEGSFLDEESLSAGINLQF